MRLTVSAQETLCRRPFICARGALLAYSAFAWSLGLTNLIRAQGPAPNNSTALVSPARTLKTYNLPDLTLKYPDDWVAMKPEDVAQRASGNLLLTPECVLVIANPNNWGQNVNVQIHHVPGYESVSPEQLKSLGESARENLAKQLTGMTDFSQRIIIVAGVPALEVNLSSFAFGKKQRQRSVILVTREKLYNVTFTAPDSEFADAEAKTFRFMLDTQETVLTRETVENGSGESTSPPLPAIAATAILIMGTVVVLFVRRRSSKWTR